MGFWVLMATAVALAMDAFAVSIAAGLTLGTVTRRQTFRLSFHFGLFQSLMTFLGWAAGLTIRSLIEAVDHWLALGLLAFVAVRMIADGLKKKDETQQNEKPKDPTKGATMVLLSVATSIDALAVGLSLSLLSISIWVPVLVIGLVALAFTGVGLHLGRWVGATARLGRAASVAGGIVLLTIAVNILREHGVFGT